MGKSEAEIINARKIVIFGAGKIGRSFIGQLFSTGGYEVVFVDIDERIIKELNRRNNYNIIIKSEITEVKNITNVRGVNIKDEHHVAYEVATAGILAVSVGLNGLGSAISSIARGLLKRYSINASCPLDIIIAENLRHASEYMINELRGQLPEWFPLETYVGAVETSIGKMVPIMLKKDMEEDILQVFAEHYNTLILDEKAFLNPIPDISGLAPRKNMKAWVDRKLFIHNLGHATTAYIGFLYNSDFIYIYEALSVPAVHKFVRYTMLEAAQILMSKYPGEFTGEMLIEHIDDLIGRFGNIALQDTIFRVGSDLKRKLSPEDRLTGCIRLALEQNKPYRNILIALVCACHFRAGDEQGQMLPDDSEIIQIYNDKCRQILLRICRFDEKRDISILLEAEEIEKIILSGNFLDLLS